MQARADSKTIFIDGQPVDVSYEQPRGKVSITIAPHLPLAGELWDQLVTGAHVWVDQLRFDLFSCRDLLYDHDGAITVEIDCPEKQDAVLRKLPYLFERLTRPDTHRERQSNRTRFRGLQNWWPQTDG